MEHEDDDKLPTFRNTLKAVTVRNNRQDDECAVKEAEHLLSSIQNKIQQLQTEICSVKSSNLKSLELFEGNEPWEDDIDENVANKECRWKSLHKQEKELKSQLENLHSNINSLEEATVELKSSISTINSAKEKVRGCFTSEENLESESLSANYITVSNSNSTSEREPDHQRRIYNSTIQGTSSNAVPSPFHNNPNKKARLSFANENTDSGCQSVVQNCVSGTVADPQREGIVNKLSQDELELIFKQSFITTNDLLNFRCVNSTWRDAATSILLFRDSCQLNLELKSIPASDKNNKQKIVYCRKHLFKTLPLTDLLPTIRASRKFPTTSLNFPGESTVRSTLIPNFHNQKELLQFFTLYGKFIKSIFIGILISRKELEDLLQHYTPNLECLKFKSVECISDKIEGNLFSQSTSTSGLCSSLKVICTGPCSTIGIESKQCSANVKALLDVASNLEAIKNVPLELLRILVEEQKVHLIKELNFVPYDSDAMLIEMTNKLAQMNPKLSVLNVVFDNLSGNSYTSVISDLNSLLESSKDTLEYLTIKINPFNFPRKIRIPILKNLNCIRFAECTKKFRMPFRLGLEDPIFEFPETASLGHELFPNLFKVKLDSLRNFDVGKSLMRFFPYYLRGHGSFTDNSVPSVKVLEISHRIWPSVENSKSISRLFPNIRSLTLEIGCTFGKTFGNCVWRLCPLAESIEIIIGKTNRRFGGYHVKMEAVDSFFTGIPSLLCVKLRGMESPLNYTKDKKMIEFLRVMPSICDLQYLKFLNVRFFKLSSPFISTVSCLYAFKQMPDTKVTFTCDPSVGISDRKKMASCLFDVAEFVNVDIDTTWDGIILDRASYTEEDAGEEIHTDNDTYYFSSTSYTDDDDSMDSLSD